MVFSNRHDSFRGAHLSKTFCDNFKASKFYTEIYCKHPSEIIIGVRDGYINLYYNCASLAKISNTDSKNLMAEISSYYLDGKSPGHNIKITPDEFVEKYHTIKQNSSKKNKPEKEAQERLFIDNNMNPDSKWFCIDVEYTKSYAETRLENWRFDIIAILKEAPFTVALIELKYGNSALGGKSGITKHIADFYNFHKKKSFKILKRELIAIIKISKELGVHIPEPIQKIQLEDIDQQPAYYFITLDNNKEKRNGTLPMATMAGYLFEEANGDWAATRYSKKAGTQGYFAVVGNDTSFKPVFLFSESTLPHLGIYDILDPKQYIKKTVRTKAILENAPFYHSIEDLMTYEKKQQKRQEIFRESITKKGFSIKNYILVDSERDKNLYNWQDKASVQRVKDYFKNHKIKWWYCCFDAPKGQKPDGLYITCHLLSSQVACINHLFFIKHDKEAVLSIINGINGMPTRFKDVMNIPCDKGLDNYIAFEVIASKDYLHEKYLKRGEYCTSVDALVYALDENNERWLIPIEWKYTETYKRDDKSKGKKGKTRLSRYCNTEGDNLIGNSKQLKSLPDYKHSIYFQEPFYQLMRQTLWAECICNNKEEKVLPAEHFVHIHVCPKENKELLNKWYAEVTSKPSMEEAWREMLSDQSLYHLVDPKELLQPIATSYPKLYNYLQERYWQ